jgi:Predicted glutamine amidotransferases
MKKILFLLMLAVSITACSQQKKTDEKQEKDFPEHSLAIMNPTVNNIKMFRYLVDNNILPNANDFGMIGFYHTKQSYNFEQSQKYIDENNLPMKLIKCEGKLSAKNIYEQNECSDLFSIIFEETDGVFFFGGPDIPSECFGEPTHLMTSITDPYRHFFELSFLFQLLGGTHNENYTAMLENEPEYVVVGFCLGMQTMNCATGGTLIQDIPMEVYNITTAEEMLKTEVQHKNYNKYFDYDNELTGSSFHKIKPKGENFIAKLIGNTEPYVLSYHHQSAKNIGKNFEIAATSPDGKIVEAIVHTKYPHVVGTQFHPEQISLYDKDAKIKINLQDIENQNYLQMYGGERGENFHREYWKAIGEWLNYLKKPTTAATF